MKTLRRDNSLRVGSCEFVVGSTPAVETIHEFTRNVTNELGTSSVLRARHATGPDVAIKVIVPDRKLWRRM